MKKNVYFRTYTKVIRQTVEIWNENPPYEFNTIPLTAVAGDF